MKLDVMLIAFSVIAVFSAANAIIALTNGNAGESGAWFVASVSAGTVCVNRLKLLS